jgi:isopentenyl-diphosphate delta-isomerase
MQEPVVILVDNNDVPTGTAEKMHAHRKAMLHRAVSVFILNSRGEWLLQRRVHEKYHSGGLWTNTCCTHPFPGESANDAAKRRLHDEMGLQCELNYLFSFIYKGDLDNGLTEHELDHVFFGISDQEPVINKSEVAEYQHIPYHDLKKNIENDRSSYTYWFRVIYEEVNNHIMKVTRQC